jgi:CheY-like chemotaxis protein
MSEIGKILIADDEEVARESTAELLRTEGYDVTCAVDAFEASRALKDSNVDLLVADIRMPGNTNLEFVQSLPSVAPGMPVLLITGYPTLESAIASVRLPVVGYLVKPFEVPELLTMVRSAVEYARVSRSVRLTKERLTAWQTDLESALARPALGARLHSSTSVGAFMEMARENLMGTIHDLIRVAQVLSGSAASFEVCHLMNCPRLDNYETAIREAIRVLERTKNAFKSKDLGELRKALEKSLEDGGTAAKARSMGP